ncbi:Uncharacterised protein [Corynebacterium diphtheriae]|nr:Uncharacterised protein [Corynebacterium diphtheriae]
MLDMNAELARQFSTLSQYLELIDVGFLCLHAEHGNSHNPEPPAFQLDVSIRPEAETPQDEPLMARVALRVDVMLPNGKVSAEPYAEFILDRSYGEALNHAALTAYANDRVVYDLLPFVREALSDLSSRVFKTQLIMPYFDREELQFPLPTPDDLPSVNREG